MTELAGAAGLQPVESVHAYPFGELRQSVAQKLTTGRVSVGLAGGGAFGLGPGRRREGWHFGGFGFGQAFKNILEIFGRIDAVMECSPKIEP